MDWTTQNAKDEAMLNRLNLEMFNVDLAGGDETGARQIGASNARLLELTTRFAALTKDRVRLADERLWLDRDSREIAGHREKALVETWDLLLALRRFLAERAELLGRLETATGQRLAMLQEKHRAVRDRLAKALEKERRRMVAASPSRGNAHFADLLDSNDGVMAACQACDPVRANLDAIVSAKRKAEADLWTVRARQREVFPLIVA